MTRRTYGHTKIGKPIDDEMIRRSVDTTRSNSGESPAGRAGRPSARLPRLSNLSGSIRIFGPKLKNEQRLKA